MTIIHYNAIHFPHCQELHYVQYFLKKCSRCPPALKTDSNLVFHVHVSDISSSDVPSGGGGGGG
jgi:hypothetical protein